MVSYPWPKTSIDDQFITSVMPEADILSELVQSTLATQANHVHFLMTFQALFNFTYCTCPSTLLLFLIAVNLT